MGNADQCMVINGLLVCPSVQLQRARGEGVAESEFQRSVQVELAEHLSRRAPADRGLKK